MCNPHQAEPRNLSDFEKYLKEFELKEDGFKAPLAFYSFADYILKIQALATMINETAFNLMGSSFPESGLKEKTPAIRYAAELIEGLLDNLYEPMELLDEIADGMPKKRRGL